MSFLGDIFNDLFNIKKQNDYKTNSKIDLKKLAEVRKNIKKEYSEDEVREYAYELFRNYYFRYEYSSNKKIMEHYQEVRGETDILICLDRELVTQKFLGLTDLDVLRILSNENFIKKLEEGIKEWIGHDVLEQLTYKTELEQHFKRDYEYKKQYAENRLAYYTHYTLGYTSNYNSYVHFKLYFKY